MGETVILIILISILGILAICAIYCLIILYRNEKVCAFRCKMIDEDIDQYDKMSSYDEMLYKFWIPLKKEYWITDKTR